LHRSGVAESSTSFGWGKGWNVTSAGWQVTLYDPIWHVSSSSGEACCELLYPVTLLYFTTFETDDAVAAVCSVGRRFGTKCGGCGQGILPNDLVRRARQSVYHLACFVCSVCRKQLSTGEQLYVVDDTQFICKDDFIASSKLQTSTGTRQF